jgi:S1-C subfamily serine protease
MQMGAGSTQAQPQETTILTLNGKPVKNAAELQSALDSLAPGAAVKIVYKVKGVDRVIEGVAK